MHYRYIIETQIMSTQKRLKELSILLFTIKDEMGMWSDDNLVEGFDNVLDEVRKSLKISEEQLEELKNGT